MSSRIEQLIDEIEEYIDNCKYQPLSNSKIIVNKDEIDDLLRELSIGYGVKAARINCCFHFFLPLPEIHAYLSYSIFLF